jgi:hypothetical protein
VRREPRGLAPGLRLRGPAFVLLTALWPVLWYLRTQGPAWPTQFLIPSFVLIVLSTVLAWGASPFPATSRLTKAAFAFVAAGDVFINLTPWPGGSVPAFIFAHLCLAAAFLRESRFQKKDLPLVLPPVIAAALFARAELPLVMGAARAAVLVTYLVAVSLMLWRALCSLNAGKTTKVLVRILGAVLFFATDLFAIATVAQSTRGYIGWIWALYPPALICLAWSSWSTRVDERRIPLGIAPSQPPRP